MCKADVTDAGKPRFHGSSANRENGHFREEKFFAMDRWNADSDSPFCLHSPHMSLSAPAAWPDGEHVRWQFIPARATSTVNVRFSHTCTAIPAKAFCREPPINVAAHCLRQHRNTVPFGVSFCVHETRRRPDHTARAVLRVRSQTAQALRNSIYLQQI